MTNHVHLLVTPSEAGAVGAMMQDVGRRYVRVINGLHGRSGSLWEGRFKSSLIDSENYLLTCHRYIELNPVRAGMVRHPAEHAWSSFSHYGTAQPNALITEHPDYRRLGTSPEERRAAFRSLYAEPMQQQVIDQIRIAINTESALGSEEFLRYAENKLGRSVRVPKQGRPARRVAEKLF